MNKDEIVKALALADFKPLYDKAHEVKRSIYGDDIYVRAIVEFSNYCRMDCSYCGLFCHNKKIKRYRMTPSEIIDTAINAHNAGYKTLVMQSGEDAFFTPKLLGEIVGEIKKTGIIITLSCGEKSREDYGYLKKCGADRYLLKHECSDEGIYSTLHTKSTLQNRLRCLYDLKSLGYETGSGFMIGLPNQTLTSVANDIQTLVDIPCDMAGIGPFIPHPDTPLHDIPAGSAELTKRAVALTRIIMGRINLPATTSLGVLDTGERDDIFACGANVIMKKVTPQPYRSWYEIYPSANVDTDVFAERERLEQDIKALGYNPV